MAEIPSPSEATDVETTTVMAITYAIMVPRGFQTIRHVPVALYVSMTVANFFSRAWQTP